MAPALLVLLLLLSAPEQASAKSKGHGCEKLLDKHCPDWKTEPKAKCLACVDKNIKHLEPQCATKHKAEGKCSPLGPSPPGPPAPPGPSPPKPHGPSPPATPPVPPVPLPARPAPPAKDRPNVVFMLTDDQDLELGSMNAMSFTRALGATGANFTQFMAHTPVCCPSRSELLTGRYFHSIKGSNFTQKGCMHVRTDEDTPTGDPLPFASALKKIGYATGMYGKYLNSGGMGKICAAPVGDSSLHVPTGWLDFLGACPDTCYVDCNYNHNGKSAWFTNASATEGSNYGTSVIGNVSLSFAKRAMAANWPFFVYIASHAPHGPVSTQAISTTT